MAHTTDCPRLDASAVSTRELCKLFRAIDVLEEAAHMANQSAVFQSENSTAASIYLEELAEFLFAERAEIADELRSRPATDDLDGTLRLCVLIQYDAWSQVFEKPTLDQFVTSSFVKEVRDGRDVESEG